MTNGAFDFFIAHASEDLPHAEALHKHLEPPHRVFLDRKNLIAGETWPAQLEKSLRAAQRIVIMLSPRAAEKYYVREEICIALYEEMRSGGKKKVIPLLLPDWLALHHTHNGALPYGLASRQLISVGNEAEIAKAAAELKLIAGSSSTSDAPASGPNTVQEEKHPLHAYPRGPLVKEYMLNSIPDAFAQQFQAPVERLRRLAIASQYRLRADRPPARPPTLVRPQDLPPAAMTPATEWWAMAFSEACRHGPRMLAAMLETTDTEMFPSNIQMEIVELLEQLKTYE